VLTITGSNPGHVSANGSISGSTDMNAAGSIFYYNGDLQIDNGVTVALTGNVQLRIKGFLQNNGTINGKAGGIAGAGIVAVPVSATSSNPARPASSARPRPAAATRASGPTSASRAAASSCTR
jgi:hypothetical protein